MTSEAMNKMREVVKHAPKYHGAKKWMDRVDHMSDQQVYAIYMRMMRDNEL